MTNCITVRSSFVGTRQGMAGTLASGAEGKDHADIKRPPSSAVNAALDRLEHGDVPSRVVLRCGDA